MFVVVVEVEVEVVITAAVLWFVATESSSRLLEKQKFCSAKANKVLPERGILDW